MKIKVPIRRDIFINIGHFLFRKKLTCVGLTSFPGRTLLPHPIPTLKSIVEICLFHISVTQQKCQKFYLNVLTRDLEVKYCTFYICECVTVRGALGDVTCTEPEDVHEAL